MIIFKCFCWITAENTRGLRHHYSDVIMGGMRSQITSLTIVYRLFRSRLRKISKLRVAGLCAGNSPVTGEFPAQVGNNAENVYDVIIMARSRLWQSSQGRSTTTKQKKRNIISWIQLVTPPPPPPPPNARTHTRTHTSNPIWLSVSLSFSPIQNISIKIIGMALSNVANSIPFCKHE